MEDRKTFWRQPEWIAGILITAVAVALHFYYWLHIGGLWRDEVNLLNLSGRNSLAEMEKDSFPILMPLTVHAWLAMGLGNNDLHLRLLGLLVGLGILAALWISSWSIRRQPPLLGLVLFGLNSTAIFFGDSLRAYGLGSLLAAGLTASGYIFLLRPSALRAAVLAMFAVLSVQVLYHNAVLVAAVCFGAWAVCWRRAAGRAALQILLVAALAAASLLPYAHNGVFSAGASTPRTGVQLWRFFRSYGDTLGYPRSGYIYAWALLYAIIVLVAIAKLTRKNAGTSPKNDGPCLSGDLVLFPAVTLTFAVIGFPLFFWRAQMPMQSWYVLPFLASAVVSFDALPPVRHWMLRLVLLGFVAVTAGLAIPATSGILKQRFSDVDVYARTLAADAAPGDYIVVVPWTCGITFAHYFKGATAWNTLPPLSDHSVHRFDLVQLQMQNTNAIAPVLRQIGQTLESGHRVWVLAAANMMGIPAPGTPVPSSLPPPPLKYYGWSESPYSAVWAAQTAHFLADHSDEFKEFQPVFPQRCIAENMEIFVARGWKTNSPAH